MSFHEQPFVFRYGQMGDRAEDAALEHYPERLHPYGWNRPEVNMAKMSDFIRYQPDFICHSHMLEAQGTSKRGLMKFKLEKVAAQTEWAEKWDGNLKWFLWLMDRWAVVHHGWVLERVSREVAENRIERFGDNGKPYVVVDLQAEVDPVLWTFVGDPGSGATQAGGSDAEAS